MATGYLGPNERLPSICALGFGEVRLLNESGQSITARSE